MKATFPEISRRTSTGSVCFGGPVAKLTTRAGHPVLGVALPVLAGSPEESLGEGRAEVSSAHGFELFEDGSCLAGFAVAAAGADLEQGSRELYRRLFAATAGRHLYRVWNYVPAINAAGSGLENYQRFCRGRSLAFEERFGSGFNGHLPAASAVGAAAGPLAVAFVAGRAAPIHVENPRQVPAFSYPRQYGPRSPSFSRATVADWGRGRRLYVSGTAAIRGHATVAAGSLDGQLDCTIENLRLVGEAAGAGPDLGAGAWRRRFKVYLRHAEDLSRVRARLDAELLGESDEVTYLQAEICRAELLVEIETVLSEEG